MDTYIVECLTCQQAWEVDRPLYSAPGAWIVIPDHRMLRFDTGREIAVPCPGSQVAGIGLGERSEWERRWQLRFPLRSRPDVKPGEGVELTG